MALSGNQAVLITNGVTELTISKWLLEASRDMINGSATGSEQTPYIADKVNDTKHNWSSLTNFIEAPGMEVLKEALNKKDMAPEYKETMAVGPETVAKTLLAARIIKIENAIYRIYNRASDVSVDSTDVEDVGALNNNIDAYVYEIFSRASSDLGLENKSSSISEAAILVGAITTDFTPFYSKFRGIIENSGPKDNIVIAAQEHSAKYTSAYVSSPAFKKYADALVRGKSTGTVDYSIQAIAIFGAAGSGKTTATSSLGLSIGTDILRDNGVAEVEILPIANNLPQVENLVSSIGTIKGAQAGKTVDQLLDLMKKVSEGDTAAVAQLKDVGVILIDEVTYISWGFYNNKLLKLNQINAAITDYNTKNRKFESGISLVVMGDPEQSGSMTLVGGTSPTSTTIDRRRVFSLNYMDYSFRGRNNFLRDSLDAIRKSAPGKVGNVSTALRLQS